MIFENKNRVLCPKKKKGPLVPWITNIGVMAILIFYKLDWFGPLMVDPCGVVHLIALTMVLSWFGGDLWYFYQSFTLPSC